MGPHGTVRQRAGSATGPGSGPTRTETSRGLTRVPSAGAAVRAGGDRGAGEDPPAVDALTVARLLAVLPHLSQPDRQRLYEELHAVYDCRIYRP